MSTDTRKVDVLYIMREAASLLIRDGHQAIPDDLLVAHDALAEFIERVRDVANYPVTPGFERAILDDNASILRKGLARLEVSHG
ncbi:hypothetical protein [Luteibacter sp. SG786]|uniref:hypothetical protein n=1 Tax=Luteibacter sp. SG786 TaxID=2587130 RepID=UPI001423ADCE|nr:hypothetical protein [Luteibacter sp. SG786]NII54368.1 hypothetical protein [Luteibacter sp. SG786]